MFVVLVVRSSPSRDEPGRDVVDLFDEMSNDTNDFTQKKKLRGEEKGTLMTGDKVNYETIITEFCK